MHEDNFKGQAALAQAFWEDYGIYKSKAESLVCTIAKAGIRMRCKGYEQDDSHLNTMRS
jgi:hypothetical protein